jgi:hypothetical protein
MAAEKTPHPEGQSKIYLCARQSATPSVSAAHKSAALQAYAEANRTVDARAVKALIAVYPHCTLASRTIW